MGLQAFIRAAPLRPRPATTPLALGSIADRRGRHSGYRFPPEIIQHAIWLYIRFTLSFRDVERPVNVGDVVGAGQVVAQLDPQIQQNSLRSAQADLASAEAVLTHARLTFGRQQKLLAGGWTTRARFDEAEQALVTAQAQVNSAQAHLRIAQDQLSYTDLLAEPPRARLPRSAPNRAKSSVPGRWLSSLHRHPPDSCRAVRQFAPFPRFGQSCAVGAG